MAMESKVIYVYDHFSSEEPALLGTLCVDRVRERERFSFEYDPDWLKSSAYSLRLDPDLELYHGRQYPVGSKKY